MPDHIIIPTQGRLQRSLTTKERTDLLALAKQAAEDGAFDEVTPEFFPVTASTNAIDSYGTFMAESTLRNFAADAVFDGKGATGVSVLDSHDGRRLGFGRSLTGEYITGSDLAEGADAGFRSVFFTVPGIVLEGRSTDSYIAGIKSGLWFDISVGFWMPTDARITCSICGKDMWRWYGEDGDWHHFPGVEYEVEADGKTTREIAYGKVENARLSEYSLVYDGATPGAGVAKARSMEDAGELDWRIAEMLERTYHTTFPRAMAGRTFATGTQAERKQREERMVQEQRDIDVEEQTPAVVEITDPEPVEEEELTVIPDVVDAEPTIEPDPEEQGDQTEDWDDWMTPAFRAALNTELAETGITVGSRAGAAILTLGRKVSQLTKRCSELTTQAADGVTYREDLIEDTIRAAISALPAGTKTDADALKARYQRQLATATIEDIKATRDERMEAARRQFPVGPVTRDDAHDVTPDHQEVPDEYFVDVR